MFLQSTFTFSIVEYNVRVKECVETVFRSAVLQNLATPFFVASRNAKLEFKFKQWNALKS